ncbi:MAG: FAD-binding oxidoreductase [Rhodospirillaceae bacterium]|nr:FAD-binding oxidoreductase [Rhodospirillales bacterium]
MKLAGWGNFPRMSCRVATLGAADEAQSWLDQPPMIARGLGRSYGDAALQPNLTLLTRRLDHILAFDPVTGLLSCEAGVTLETILDVFLPRGWLPPVSPGTKFVTLGGMVAADVHGKNHHKAGSFGGHVRSLRLMLADGRVVECGPDVEPELFWATIGGMGLTGLILSVSFHLLPVHTAFIRSEVLCAPNLEAAFDAFEASAGWTYTVAWIDCLTGGRNLGRCLLTRGELAEPDELPPGLLPRRKRPKRVPVDLPNWVLNRWSMRAFNTLYYNMAPAKPRPAIMDLDSFFYPLDALLEWNRIYGRNGFTQYQCVLPKPAGREGLRHLLATIQKSGFGSFLAVLKLFGGHAGGCLSFPMEGYTLALDFPVRPPTLALLHELDAIVADHAGRLYLAKDARTTPGMLRKGYPRLVGFQHIRDQWGATGRMQSLLAERLDL